jgi:hypothetical protein
LNTEYTEEFRIRIASPLWLFRVGPANQIPTPTSKLTRLA